ncbi:MAG: 7TM-DISM domain-containing protein, partial [Proteobacteria bacterium]|nr:7TM-DISM domain-containing protein [Pseudomonadota bacterium]
LIITIPTDEMDYALYLEDYYCSYRLFVDGELVGTNGKVALKEVDYVPEWRPQVVDLGGRSKQMEIVFQIANYDHSKGGAKEAIRFGLADPIHSEFSTLETMAVLLSAFLVFLAIFFLIRFGFVSLDLASFYFSLFCLFYSYRIIGADLYVLHSIIPEYPWHIAILFEYCTLFISPFLFAKYIQSMYPEETHRQAINGLGLIGFAFIAVTIFTSPEIYTLLIEPFFIILMIYLIYGFTVFIAAFLKKRDGSIYGILSVAIAFAVFSFLIFVYFGWLTRLIYASFLGYMVFLILQSIQLYTYSSKRKIDINQYQLE